MKLEFPASYCHLARGIAQAYLLYVVTKNPKTPNLNPMADDAITRGGIQGLGSPMYVCG